MKARHKRFLLIAVALGLLAAATALVLNAFRDNLVFFHTPSEVAEGKAPQGRPFRVGGMVLPGSLERDADGLTVRFIISDTAQIVPVVYRGALPDLFKETKGAVAQGSLGADGVFVATEVLAKHDENYMPPEAQDAIDRAHNTAKTLQ
ncbi:MAG: cytochrome c biogenesis protein CcmE [Candidatus Dactylopiibacterium carminicum]|uniref:Cytochrome c-type biogenesis protein CcmE n=1 Tax=Candidatus Dactylopiibacterium carminicum TaxID=857335 RepID=A0A272EXG2_9RHOO|nr:cytochrome c maturation protein CcmE [Candidatus Dactylopiibacterium carminicum]KAF7600178.1 cytochrome c maturation protein CcmE [Candidatus Dactylopiibacterium carminicum]PAS94803.1 MAG: cytochrome c biogenesis protein CcmE [Candidatus Dactylopiibacterium carminicum]PAS97727.1 MAG: cytochrome c biogenesis protein CcmE [Candidatus Dactylopiibacterium carminicum]PAT00179.1 MAG: cytochrome c biogenesis protein CcmE [Candidatus Dactylopiibacterium carminicum]